jgi:hypothetical protein
MVKRLGDLNRGRRRESIRFANAGGTGTWVRIGGSGEVEILAVGRRVSPRAAGECGERARERLAAKQER